MTARESGKGAWRKVLVEGGTIVFSILLAFAIDAAWSEREERRQEQEALRALRSDFVESQALLNRTLALQMTAEDRMGRLARMSRDEILALDHDSVAVIMNAMAFPATFDPVRATVDAMIGAGQLGILRNDLLRQRIAAFVNSVDDSAEDAELMREFAVRTWDAVTAYGGPFDAPLGNRGVRAPFLPEPSPEDLAELKDDQRVMGLALQGRLNATIYVDELRDVRSQIDRILELVDEGIR